MQERKWPVLSRVLRDLHCCIVIASDGEYLGAINVSLRPLATVSARLP